MAYSPTLRDRSDLLQESEEQFRMSDESAYSIVPSHMSRSIYTVQTTDSGASKAEEDLVYKPLTFENELFTARVYKRNYRTLELQRLFKDTKQKPSDKTRPRIVAQENVEDSHDSKSENLTIRETKSTPLWYTKAQSTTLLPTKGQPVGHKDTRGGINTSPNAEPRLSFAEACEQGNVEIVETFLESGQDVHVPEVPDMSAVHLAAKGGHIQIAKILLSYGADKEMLSRVSRKRPLHLAVQAGHVAMVRYLLDNGTNIAAPDGVGAQAIHAAAGLGSTVILSLLLDYGAAIDSAMNNGFQPLHVASQTLNRADVIKFLWCQGADIEAKTNDGRTPFYYASLYDYEDNMKVLLELGAARSPSILSTALELVSLQTIRLLLEHRVDPYRPDSDPPTALHRQLESYPHYHLPNDAKIAKLLLVYGPDVDLQDSNGDTPLHRLCSRRKLHLRYETPNQQRYVQISLAKILSRRMRDVDTVNLAGRTALGVSMEQESKDWLSGSLFDSGARLLLRIPHIEIGLDLERSCTGYMSILTFCLRQGSNTLTKTLGYYGQDPQDRIIKFHKAPTALLRHFLRDPESLDLKDMSGFDMTALLPYRSMSGPWFQECSLGRPSH